MKAKKIVARAIERRDDLAADVNPFLSEELRVRQRTTVGDLRIDRVGAAKAPQPVDTPTVSDGANEGFETVREGETRLTEAV
jgi:hypothetical protein